MDLARSPLSHPAAHLMPTPSSPLQKSLHHLPATSTRLYSAVTVASHTSSHHHVATGRRSANYEPTSWSYDFLQSINIADAVGIYESKAKKLEREMRQKIREEEAKSILNVLELVDDIQRLGLGQVFEKDIKGILDRIASSKCPFKPQKSLHATALLFRLLRQHGYQVSQDAFAAFADEEGNFVGDHDIQGMLSLYEASHVGKEGEPLLETAKAHSRKHLENVERKAECVSHALELPLYRRTHLLEARWFIEAYKRREDANSKLLQLAKLNFNMLQSLLQRDLKDMSRWWHNLGLVNKLSFSRDRLMECFFWAVGVVSEPQFSSCRKGLTKVASFVTIIDDVYDVYGTKEELELFTEAVERWDVKSIGGLPDYMKLCFLAFYNSVNDMAYDNLKERGEDVIPYLTKAWADLLKAFLQEAKWRQENYTPSFEEYLENGWRSVSGTVFLVHAYFLMGENVSPEALHSLTNYHPLLCAPSIIFRLCNDLATSSAELGRGETVNAITCYMSEHGVSEEQARDHMKQLIDKAWKSMMSIHEVHNTSPFSQRFVETATNLARIAHCTYRHGDSHGAPDAKSKQRVIALFVDPIPVLHG